MVLVQSLHNFLNSDTTNKLMNTQSEELKKNTKDKFLSKIRMLFQKNSITLTFGTGKLLFKIDQKIIATLKVDLRYICLYYIILPFFSILAYFLIISHFLFPRVTYTRFIFRFLENKNYTCYGYIALRMCITFIFRILCECQIVYIQVITLSFKSSRLLIAKMQFFQTSKSFIWIVSASYQS